MAQIEQSSGGKQKKGAQKKMQIHVDFTDGRHEHALDHVLYALYYDAQVSDFEHHASFK